jgi:hypothetical protein
MRIVFKIVFPNSLAYFWHSLQMSHYYSIFQGLLFLLGIGSFICPAVVSAQYSSVPYGHGEEALYFLSEQGWEEN